MIKKRAVLFLAGSLFFLSLLAPARVEAQWPRITLSADGVPISYEVHGDGEPTLVFVHGWSCDARYWGAQVSYFSMRHQVITLDLAGHGHSGLGRSRYTMESFGEDVAAVVEAAGAERAILIGHSMGGQVIACAARVLPGRVSGLIGVDTLENVGYVMTPEEREAMLAPFREDFPAETARFAGEMLSPAVDRSLREWIVSDMSSAPPWVAVSAMEEMTSQYVTGEAARVFEEVRLPVVSVKSDKWPVDFKANREHMLSYEAIVIADADHFLMMTRPEEFNEALEKAIGMILWEAGK
ncbi:MAG: alpha/beta hydrolase [Thermovirgaceae bacterium]|nr:alpha/beta hydrolase [Synergistales bacterium]HPC76471.1 alpha/beta hydrolase [Synergistales bacterium]HRS48939.1 alpha/beta hydrolase [Thermovirgaceae bacterium]HRU91240.1 alpha/beta hydrolase [Thermovirgaceae bacterium]